jgi:hypothetical protein
MTTKADELLLAIIEAEDAEDRYRFNFVACGPKVVAPQVQATWNRDLTELTRIRMKAWAEAREYLAKDGYVCKCS